MNFNKIEYSDYLEFLSKNKINNSISDIHHITPRCMGGNDNQENLISLTKEDHFIAHVYLMYLFPEVEGLRYAVTQMYQYGNFTNHIKHYTEARVRNWWVIDINELQKHLWTKTIRDTVDTMDTTLGIVCDRIKRFNLIVPHKEKRTQHLLTEEFIKVEWSTKTRTQIVKDYNWLSRDKLDRAIKKYNIYSPFVEHSEKIRYSELEEIQQLLRKYTLFFVARMYNFSGQGFTDFCRRNNITVYNKRKQTVVYRKDRTNIDVDKVQEYLLTHSIAQTAKYFDVDYNTIIHRVIKYNLKVSECDRSKNLHEKSEKNQKKLKHLKELLTKP